MVGAGRLKPKTCLTESWKNTFFDLIVDQMDSVVDNTPSGWLEILEEGDADIAAGRIVSSETVHRMLRESIARLEAQSAERQHEAASRH